MSHSDPHDSQTRADMDALSRAYRDARDDEGMAPPAALDDAIRAAAHRAVHSGPTLAGSSWLRRWTPQLAVAALVVLSVSVVMVSIEERPELAPASIQEMARNQAAEPPAEATAPMQTRIAESVPARVVAAEAVKKKADAETSSTVVADAQVARQKDAMPAKEEQRLAAAPSNAPPPPPQVAAATVASPPAASAVAPPPASATVVAQAVPAPFPAVDAIAPARKEARADARYAAAPEAKPVEEKVVAAVAPAPMMKQLAPANTTSAGAAVGGVQSPPLLDAARNNAQAARSSGSVGSRAVSSEEFKAAEDERPGPWLKRLLELREQNKLKELREQLPRFKKAHPDVVLPKVLTELPGADK